MSNRVIVNFSCGAASAVATKICIDAWSSIREVKVVYADLSADEHPDNGRFLEAVEQWAGCKIERVRNTKYIGVDDVFLTERYIVGITGAACTKRLKRDVIDKICTPDDIRVIGFTADERDRIDAIVARNLQMKFAWVLADAGITKADCYRILQNAGIALPWMYLNGYDHNNCIGCVKGGMGYWNKIRRDFPEVFARRAAIQREIGAGAGFGGGSQQFFLDELAPDAGRDQPEPDIECGVFCSLYSGVLDNAVTAAKGVA